MNTLEEMNQRKYVPSYSELIKTKVDGDENWWCERLVYGWSEKKWCVPLLPKLEKRTLLIRERLPHLTNTNINAIVRDLNKTLRQLKTSQ